MKACCFVILLCILISKFATAQLNEIKTSTSITLEKEKWKMEWQNSFYYNHLYKEKTAILLNPQPEVRNAFAKGKWMMPYQQNLKYSNYNFGNDSADFGDENNLRLHLEADYFIQNNIAIGFDLRSRWTGEHYANDDLFRSWNAKAKLLYGKPLNDNSYLYGQVFVGYGSQKEIYKFNNVTNTDKATEFSYGLTVGAPIRFMKSNAFINPTITYEREKVNYDDSEESNNSIRFGLQFYSFMMCSEYGCDKKPDYAISKDRYLQGRSFIDYTTMGKLEFGSYKVTYDAFPNNPEKGNITMSSVRLAYNYYFIDNVAFGLGLSVGKNKQKPDDGNNEFSTSRYMLTPKITAQLPVKGCLRNAFVEAGYGFGMDKIEYDYLGTVQKEKQKVSGLTFGVGYNVFVSKNLAFTPIIGYDSEKLVDDDTNDELRKKGVDFRFGARLSF